MKDRELRERGMREIKKEKKNKRVFKTKHTFKAKLKNFMLCYVMCRQYTLYNVYIVYYVYRIMILCFEIMV